MTHPDELLPDYALGLLEPAEAATLEAHLARCERCRAELRRLNEVLARWVDELPSEAPPQLWPRIAAKLPPRPRASRRWQPWLLAASVFVGALGLGWGVRQQLVNRQLSAQQRQIAGWLSRDDLRVTTLPELEGRRVGSVLFLSDGRALLVLRDPPGADESYQAWGHRDGERVSLGVTGGTVLEVRYEGFEFIGVSLEPKGGSSQPTQPLGRVPAS